MPRTRSCGTSPSYGQPKLVEITPSHRRPASRAAPIVPSRSASDSAIERLTFLRLCVSEAERKKFASWKRSRNFSALSRPLRLGIRTEYATPSRGSNLVSTSAPSASCGMTSARTKEVSSIRFNPASPSMPMRRTFSSVGITSGSLWKPSRGPTSRMRTFFGSCSATSHQPSRAESAAGDAADLDHAALVGTDADRPLPLLDLDVEAQLAPVSDFVELRVGGAGLALGRGGDVLDADLEAHRRLTLIEVLEGERRGVALDHADHPGSREHARSDRAAHVGEQPALDDEVHAPLHPRFERHQPDIPSPPETPRISPVT